jgi:hypothetical protein
MDATIHQNMQDLIAARRLLWHASELEALKKDPHAKVKSLKDAYEEGQVSFSGESRSVDAPKVSPGKVDPPERPDPAVGYAPKQPNGRRWAGKPGNHPRESIHC